MNFASPIPSFIQLQRFGVIEALGADAGRFLHRMSTNNIDGLKPGASCLTAFLNQKARLVGVCYVLNQGDDVYHLIVPYDNATTLMTWLDSYLFAEDVTLRDQSSEFSLTWSIGKVSLPYISGPTFRFHKESLESGFHLAKNDEASRISDELTRHGLQILNETKFETLRVAGSVPYSTNEINASYQPIQLGLSEAIHWAKGCYIGQEVISRLESKDKAEITLSGLTVTKAVWEQLKSGEWIQSDGQLVGTLTSVAPTFLPGEANALAIFKRGRPSGKMLTDLSQVGIDSTNQGE